MYTHICTYILLIMCHALFRFYEGIVNGPTIVCFRLGTILYSHTYNILLKLNIIL